MNASATYDALEVQARPMPRTLTRKLWRIFCAFWKYLLGLLACTSPLFAFTVVGWTARLMQRTAMKSWWKRTNQPYRKLLHFRDVAATRPGWTEHASWPNWIVSQSILDDLRHWRLHRLLAGLFRNTWIGLQIVLNTFVILLIPSLFWTFSWYAGWQVSFNKVYEYSQNGGLLGLSGIALFIMAMFFVPMAQTRQAVSGRWSAFYEFGLVRRIMRRRWFSCALLALGYTFCGFLTMVMIIGPISAELQDHLQTLTAEQQKGIGRLYYLGMAAIIFPLYVALRWWAARIYASAVSQMLAVGQMKPEELSPAERLAFPAHQMTEESRAEWTRKDAVLSWTLSAPFRLAGGVLVATAWLLFAFEIYVSQFFIYHGPRVWLNHPLVQLPWTDYLPAEPKIPD